MTSKKKYNSPISPKNINNIIILISIIILTIKLLIAYRFHNRINDEKLFNIQLLLVLFYYSVSTLGWSNDRLESINVIVSKCIDLFIEYQGVFIADLLIIIVIFFARRQPELTSHKHVMMIFTLFMCMRIIIHLYRLMNKINISRDTDNYNKEIQKKNFADAILTTIKDILIDKRIPLNN